jgi:plasmid stabilization system protein ParE
MDYTVKVSVFARRDKQDIMKYLAQYSTNAPYKFERELKRLITIIGRTPYIYAVFYSAPKYRYVVVFGSYILFYAVNEINKELLIYRILHSAQDIDHILR